MKLKKCLVILPLLALTLSACNTTTVSEPLDDSSATSEETDSEETGSTSEEDTQIALTNYTLSIEIRYNGDVEKVPEYADAYIAGSFNNWTFETLTENEGRYEITFATIKVGTYEYQVCLGYDAETAGSYSYRITQSNETFTITGEEGDGYVNEVSLTASNTLDSIIPDPNSVIKNVKVRFNVVYGGTPEGVLSYATLRVAGTFSNWGFVECSIEDGYYVYTFDELMPIEYEYWISIYYTEEIPSDYSTYKVNGENETITIPAGTSDGATIDTTITATNSLASILPDPSSQGGDGGNTGGDDDEPYEDDEDLTTAKAILEAVSENGLDDWEAFHGVSTDDEGTQEEYLTTLNGATYGVRYYYEDETKTTEQYFVDGTNYTYDVEEEEYSTSQTVPSFSGSLSTYSDAIDAADDDIDLDEEDEYSYVLTEVDEGGYKLVVTDSYSGSTTIYTYVVDTDYTLLEVGSDFTGSTGYSESSYAIKITYEDVALVMASFDASDWDQQVWESGDTITLYFTFTYDGQVETLEEYEQIYIIGGWNGAEWDSNDAKALTLGEDEKTYYAEFTYNSGEDVVTDGHWFSFNLFIASTSESYSWNEERKLLTDNGTWSWESGLLSASWDVELSTPFADYIDDPSTITTRYNCTVTYYFVDSAEDPQEYYSIPNYADAYVTGYLTLDVDGNNVWTDYSIGGATKLAAVGDAASDGYSVTFSEIHTGTVTYNMYFEYNGSASYHSAAENATWNADHAICSDTSNNTTMYIPTTGDCKVYIELDPSQIITDEPMTNAVDFYILFVDTGSFSETFSWTPWVSAGGAAFSDTTSCSGAVSTTNSGKMCIYNGTVGTYEAGQSDYYWIWAENIYGESGKLDISTGTITIPSNSTGYAVYVCNCSFQSGGQGSGTWYTDVADITTLIASL